MSIIHCWNRCTDMFYNCVILVIVIKKKKKKGNKNKNKKKERKKETWRGKKTEIEERGDCYNQQVTAMSTFRPAGSLSSNDMRKCVCVCVCLHTRMRSCMHVCGWNELEVCTTLAYLYISLFCTMPVYTHTHTRVRILIPFEDSELTGLKVDTA